MALVDDLPFLAIGTEVSARYKGAFCEAKIKKITKIVKCKIQYPNGSVSLVSDDAVKGPLKVGACVEIKSNDTKELVKGIIQKIQDYSQYTVVFDDGDVTSLKRTSLCLKSGKHYASSATLDQLPLTHPEHNNTAVYSSGQRSRTKKKSVKDKIPEPKKMEDIGKVVCVMSNDKKIRHNWFPGLIVTPKSQSSVKTNVIDDYLVRSFKDGKYYAIPKREITEFSKEVAAKVENPTLKTAVEKALLYLDKDELPPHWDRDLLFGLDKKCISTDSEGVSDSGNSDEESLEEKDHFVAQLFKFMDDRGTPLNQLPVINDKDVDLYKLFKVVNNFGGYNKVDKCKHWKVVATKIGHEQSHMIVKQSYVQYLQSFEDFYRKLGCTMINNPRNVRSRNRFSRSIIRDVDKSLPSTSLTSADKNKTSTSSKLESNDKKDKPETTVKENDIQKDTVAIKKVTKNTKTEEKPSNKNDDETVNKIDTKKTDSINTIDTNSLSRNRPSAKSDSKIKKELKETLKLDEDILEQLCDPENPTNKKVEKKKPGRNLFGKSVAKLNKTDKIDKVKTAETGLPNARKKRSFKEQIKTFVKVMTPFKKSKKSTQNIQLDTLNKVKSEEDLPKLTRSKSKDDFLNKSRKLSVISEPTCNMQVAQTSPSSSISESQSKVKKLDDSSEKKKASIKKKKDDTDTKITDLKLKKYKTEKWNVGTQVNVGDFLVVFYGPDSTVTYDAKVLDISDFGGGKKFYVHYKGWNSRYDEWIDTSRIAEKYKIPEVADADGDLSKNEPKNNESKKLSLPKNRTRRSVTPNVPNTNRKRSPFSNIRPTRTCTLSDRPLSSIGKYTIPDNSDSESEYSGNLGLAKQYNKKNQQTLKAAKTSDDILVKTELSDICGKRKPYPKTYPGKELLMQRNLPRKPKSCVFKVHSNVTEETEICEQITLKSPLNPNHKMPPLSDSKVLEPENKSSKKYSYHHLSDFSQDEDDGSHHELKISSIHYPSHKLQAEKYDQTQVQNEKNLELSTSTITSKNDCINFDKLLFEDTEKFDVVENEELSSFDKKPEESKISGIDFDLNEIRSEMKGLTPTSTCNSIDSAHNSNLHLLNQQAESNILKTIESHSDKADVYEFKDSEQCDFDKAVPSVIDEKHRRLVKNIGHPISYNYSELSELPSDNGMLCEEGNKKYSILQEKTEEHESSSLFESNPISIQTKDVMNFKNDSENNTSQSVESIRFNCPTDSTVPYNLTIAKPDFHTAARHIDVNDSKDQVLNLCTKQPEVLPNNIFSMSETNDSNVVEYDDDDDETKLVIADFQVDSESPLVDKKYTSVGQVENAVTEPLYPPRMSSSIDSECRRSYELKQDTMSSKECTDDESTISCDESIQNDSNFQLYTHFENESTKRSGYQTYDDNDNSSQSDFESELNFKSSIDKNVELVSSEIAINDKCKKYENNSKHLKSKSDKRDNIVLPELQCSEELVDEDTLNNSLGVGYEMYKPTTSKDNLYEMSISNNSKSSFYETEENSPVESDNFETNSSHTTKSSVIENNKKDYSFYDNASTINKNSFHENAIASVTPGTDINNVLLCEETIPGSPNGISEEQSDQEERKKTSNAQHAESEAVSSTMYDANQSFDRSVVTAIEPTKNTIEEHINASTSSSIQKDDEVHEQRHLHFLADISSKNVDESVNKSTPPKLDLPLITEQQNINQLDNSHTSHTSRRKISSHEQSKRAKTNVVPVQTTQDDANKPSENKMPLLDGKPLIEFTPDMDSPQRQAAIIAKMNELRKDYMAIKLRAAVLDRRRKKIKKRKREMTKLTAKPSTS